MKKLLLAFTAIVIVIGMMLIKENIPTYNKAPYTFETAIKNGDIVNMHGKRYNIEKLDKFIENVNKGKKDKIRITNYTIEAGAIITDLDYDGGTINYRYDNTRDAYGSPTIKKMKFRSDSIYKSGSKYFLINEPNDILID
jgi:hypothetical protein